MRANAIMGGNGFHGILRFGVLKPLTTSTLHSTRLAATASSFQVADGEHVARDEFFSKR